MDKIRYESVYILKPTLTKEEINKMIERLSSIIDNKGKIIEIQNLGIKRLAYTIKGFTQGHYLIMDFETDFNKCKEGILELEQRIRTFEEVIKFIIIRKED